MSCSYSGGARNVTSLDKIMLANHRICRGVETGKPGVTAPCPPTFSVENSIFHYFAPFLEEGSIKDSFLVVHVSKKS